MPAPELPRIVDFTPRRSKRLAAIPPSSTGEDNRFNGCWWHAADSFDCLVALPVPPALVLDSVPAHFPVHNLADLLGRMAKFG